MTGDVERSVAGWASRIRPHLERAVEAWVDAGDELLAAKQAMPHGTFEALVAELGMAPSTARRLMQISRHPVLRDRAHGHALPSSWRTLAELARMDDDDLEAAIDRGEVTPATTRAQAAALRAEPPLTPEERVRLAECEAVIRSAGERPQWWWDLCLAMELPADWMVADDNRRLDWLARLADAASHVPVEARHDILLQAMPDYEPDAPDVVKAWALTIFAGVTTGLCRDGWTDELLDVDIAATFDAAVDELEGVTR